VIIMSDRDVKAESVATNGEGAVTPWEEGQKQLAEAGDYWLTTINPNGHPHVMPLFGVWSEGHLYFTSNPDAQKAKNVEQNPHVVMATKGNTLDLIVEGEARRVSDEATLQRIADVYRQKYGWPITVENDAYDAPFGAPSAGKPPYRLYEVRPTKAFGLGTAEPYGATRWTFQ
jgi:hypothetical protein